MTLWLVGAGGMLGSAFRARLDELQVPYDPTGRELDVADRDAVMDRARAARYRCIVNCAGYTDVDGAEADEATAVRVNAAGAGHLGEAARHAGAALVHVSTDYVFDGAASAPYGEDAPARPLGAYGRSKLDGERRLIAAMAHAGAARRLYIVRTSWLFGRHGRSFVSTMLQLMKHRETLQVVDDQRGRPTYCPDLVDAALGLVGITRPARSAPGIYHFANAGATTWHGFAMEILRQARERGLGVVTERIDPMATEQLARPAPRPRFSVLSTSRIERELGVAPRPWRAALSSFLTELMH